jgi:hypothetical protein
MPRRILTALLAGALLAIALVPAVNASLGSKHKRHHDCGVSSKRALDVVGLTDDGASSASRRTIRATRGASAV